MSVIKVIEVMDNSTESWEDAAQTAVTHATQTLKNTRSIYVKELTAVVREDRIAEYRITGKISFELLGSGGPQS